jgi:hypothetical protein
MLVACTFGGGSPSHHAAGLRCRDQLQSLGIFDRVYVYTEVDLQRDQEFWSCHGDFLTTHPRGYGYWLWKPYLILRTLASIQNGDLLVYTDAGCETSTWHASAVRHCLEVIQASPDQSIDVYQTVYKEQCWSKEDLWQHMGMVRTGRRRQYEANRIVLKKSSCTVQLVQDWFDIAIRDHYHLIDDSPSLLREEIPTFVEHRHDQSIFSLLLHKSQFKITNHISHGILALRTRSGRSYIMYHNLVAGPALPFVVLRLLLLVLLVAIVILIATMMFRRARVTRL